MAGTHTSILLHVVYSTKNRRDMITPRIEAPLWNYIAGIVSNHACRLLTIGGTENHLHMLVSMGKQVAIADLMEVVKKDSSKWVKTCGSEFRSFYWQEGYGAFSIGQSGVAGVKRYIAGQKEHHKRTTFQDEYLLFLKKYQVEYDERYLWD